jgi:hypothetical protein
LEFFHAAFVAKARKRFTSLFVPPFSFQWGYKPLLSVRGLTLHLCPHEAPRRWLGGRHGLPDPCCGFALRRMLRRGWAGIDRR